MAWRLTDGSQFLHIPKTGGSWVEAALRANNLVRGGTVGRKHDDYERVINQERFFYGRQLIMALIKRKIRRHLGLLKNPPDDQFVPGVFQGPVE